MKPFEILIQIQLRVMCYVVVFVVITHPIALFYIYKSGPQALPLFSISFCISNKSQREKKLDLVWLNTDTQTTSIEYYVRSLDIAYRIDCICIIVLPARTFTMTINVLRRSNIVNAAYTEASHRWSARQGCICTLFLQTTVT